MGFIGKLLSGVSAAALLVFGTSGAIAKAFIDHPEVATEPSGTADFGQAHRTGGLAADLLKTLLTEQTIEASLRQMLGVLTPEQAVNLPLLMKNLRTMGLSLEAEAAAAETLAAIIREASDTILTPEQAASLVGDVFDQYVEPIKLAKVQDNPGTGAASATGKAVAQESETSIYGNKNI